MTRLVVTVATQRNDPQTQSDESAGEGEQILILCLENRERVNRNGGNVLHKLTMLVCACVHAVIWHRNATNIYL